MDQESLIRRLGLFARRHGWDGGFALLFAAGVALGGNAIVSGALAFGGGLLPGIEAQADDQPARVAQGVARLSMFGFAEPGRYAPAVLFPVTSHDLPNWLRPSEGLARALSVRDPVIAICMDDLGEDLAGTDHAMALPKEVAMSFLPYAETTPFLAQEAAAKGHDILVHMPMQALSSTNPGPMSLSVGAADLAMRAAWNIDRVPGAIGINNHEGSRFTADAASLAPVAKILAERRLFFFDSRTGPTSKVMEVAARYGVPSAERDIFLDDTISEEEVRHQLDLLVMVAKRQGAAIAIGHPHDVTLRLLKAWLAKDHGVTLVPLDEAMRLKASRGLTVAAR